MRRSIKRAIDVVMASVLLIVFGVPLLAVAVAIVILDRQSPLFIDRRVGRGGQLFRCYKLQTMYQTSLDDYLAAHPKERERYERERKLTDDPRVTPIGRWLRSTSVDELPQLINVIRGEMSMVGPRPLSPAEWEARGDSRELLATVHPGLTCTWQIGGRSETALDERVAMDDAYVRDWSLWGDLLIMLRTPWAIIAQRGAQ